ncbi:hypothetical protein A3Q56_06040 [Intoshia linei]|uniref:Voltage-gated hydrogen channel 1 n=1 Tax=Intoshia linei TaxID=1819745 RepID=A0A177AXT9_9BILA|nr:hypothetical protein A3Q56_06040 [Intoshia linei]
MVKSKLLNRKNHKNVIAEEFNIINEKLTFRKRIVLFLNSSPFLIFTCFIVLLDIIIAISHIIIDLNLMKESMIKQSAHLQNLIKAVKQSRNAKIPQINLIDITNQAKQTKDDIISMYKTFKNKLKPEMCINTLKDVLTEKISIKHCTDMTEYLNLKNIQYYNVNNCTRENMYNINPHKFKSITKFLYKNATYENQNITTCDDYIDVILKFVNDNITINHDSLEWITHVLHITSIVLLGCLLFTTLVKLFAIGWTFFKGIVEIVDLIFLVTSFSLDVYFLADSNTNDSEKTVAILIVLFFWRVLRVANVKKLMFLITLDYNNYYEDNGMLVAAKQRHEYRINLQQRVTERVQKKLHSLLIEDESKSNEIKALRNLCIKHRISISSMNNCKKIDLKVNNKALSALTNAAHISLHMAMSSSFLVAQGRKKIVKHSVSFNINKELNYISDNVYSRHLSSSQPQFSNDAD